MQIIFTHPTYWDLDSRSIQRSCAEGLRKRILGSGGGVDLDLDFMEEPTAAAFAGLVRLMYPFRAFMIPFVRCCVSNLLVQIASWCRVQGMRQCIDRLRESHRLQMWVLDFGGGTFDVSAFLTEVCVVTGFVTGRQCSDAVANGAECLVTRHSHHSR